MSSLGGGWSRQSNSLHLGHLFLDLKTPAHPPPPTPPSHPHPKTKGHLRVATYLAKFAASLDFEPALITIKHLSAQRHLVVRLGRTD